jgi:hypothetical protein
MKRAHLLPFLLLILPAIATPQAAASPLPSVPHRFLQAAAQGALVDAGKGRRAEVLTFGDDLAPQLLQSKAEDTVRIADWPVAPDQRADVILTRHEVYAPDAKVLIAEGRGLRQVPRSRLAFFWGASERDEETRVFIAVDPDTKEMNGFVQAGTEINEIHPLHDVPGMKAMAGAGQHLVAQAEVFRDKAGENGAWSCGQTGAPLDLGDLQKEAAESASSTGAVTANAATLYTATLAVDTDNELMSLKFGNNATTATNYIASLIAAMTSIYERDLNVKLLQGTVILRPSTTADPYVQTASGNADGNKLDEFSNYWATHYASTPRAVTMMLSGKQPGGGASGIAWLTSLCDKSYGYSFSQVYVSGTTPSSGDVLVVAHEVGHNFGSPHTHCYKTNGVLDPIDNCYSGEGGCYVGTKSCPAPQTINGVTSVTGTLMSYCHLSGLSGCTSKTVFHPRSIALLTGYINQAANVCLFPVSVPSPLPAITTLSPTSGSTAGGTTVTINGANFQSGATVKIGGIAATSVVFVSSTRITAHTPAHATGTAAVVVTNPDANAATLANGFFYAPAAVASDFYTLKPCRLIDTRNPDGPLAGPTLAPGQSRVFTVAGGCGVPADAKSISVNITVIAPALGGNLSAYPGNAFALGTTALNFASGVTRANNAILLLSTDGNGTLGIQNSSSGLTDVTVDVNGYFQ